MQLLQYSAAKGERILACTQLCPATSSGVLQLQELPGVQVTPDQYLNLSDFMDAIKSTLEKKLADKQLLPKL